MCVLFIQNTIVHVKSQLLCQRLKVVVQNSFFTPQTVCLRFDACRFARARLVQRRFVKRLMDHVVKRACVLVVLTACQVCMHSLLLAFMIGACLSAFRFVHFSHGSRSLFDLCTHFQAQRNVVFLLAGVALREGLSRSCFLDILHCDICSLLRGMCFWFINDCMYVPQAWQCDIVSMRVALREHVLCS